mgnify:FL=1
MSMCERANQEGLLLEPANQESPLLELVSGEIGEQLHDSLIWITIDS